MRTQAWFRRPKHHGAEDDAEKAPATAWRAQSGRQLVRGSARFPHHLQHDGAFRRIPWEGRTGPSIRPSLPDTRHVLRRAQSRQLTLRPLASRCPGQAQQQPVTSADAPRTQDRQDRGEAAKGSPAPALHALGVAFLVGSQDQGVPVLEGFD